MSFALLNFEKFPNAYPYAVGEDTWKRYPPPLIDVGDVLAWVVTVVVLGTEVLAVEMVVLPNTVVVLDGAAVVVEAVDVLLKEVVETVEVVVDGDTVVVETEVVDVVVSATLTGTPDEFMMLGVSA